MTNKFSSRINLPSDLRGLSEKEVLDMYASAATAMELAYAPYSQFRVGAALLLNDGRVVSGCNVENGSFGATICAERTAIFKAVSEGDKDFRALTIIANYEKPIPPCGMCRQVLCEFGGEKVVVMTNTSGDCTIATFDEILPYQFALESR